MTQHNSLNVKLSNPQLNKLKSAIKNQTEVVLRLPSNMIGDNQTNFPHELLLTNRLVSNLCRDSASHSSADNKLSQTQLSKMMQSNTMGVKKDLLLWFTNFLIKSRQVEYWS